MSAPRSRERVTVLISAAGRRNYLVEWFREALGRVGVGGRVLVADADPNAAARAAADASFSLPPIDDDGYRAALEMLCVEQAVTVAISLNDFELSTWSAMDSSHLVANGTHLIAMDERIQRSVEDKAEMARLLQATGIRTPRTALASTLVSGAVEAAQLGDHLMVKNRYGSGSRGARRTTPEALLRDIERSAPEATDQRGDAIPDRARALEALVVQEFIPGVEFGVDCINTLDGVFAGVLARRKIRMRGGETDQATSVSPDRFVALAESLAHVTRHRGLVDCDVIEDAAGERWLIDVNPRFGGGYPFSHVAGADVPAAYVAWAAGLPHKEGWLRSRADVVAAKHIAIAQVQVPYGS